MSLPSRSSAPATSAPSTPPAWPTSATTSSRVDVDPAKVDAAQRRQGAVLRARPGRAAGPGAADRPAAVHHRLRRGRRRRDVHFLCVGTPQRRGENAADTCLRRRRRRVAGPAPDRPTRWSWASPPCRSAPPPGCASCCSRARPPARRSRLAWNPEFLREGFAVEDTLAPDRFVYGVAGPTAEADAALLDQVYAAPLAAGTPRLVTDYATAELVKASANAFLATKISFINAMAEVCEAAGADVVPARRRDRPRRPDRAQVPQRRHRLRRRLPAQGHPRVHGPRRRARRRPGPDASCARSTRSTCAAAPAWSTSPASECGGTLIGKRVAVLGAAFKPNSDDIRDSPALDIARAAHHAGATVTVHDPKALPVARRGPPRPDLRRRHRGRLPRRRRRPAPDRVAASTARSTPPSWAPSSPRKAVIDGRNALDPERWRAAGWTYRALGRPSA